MSELALASKSCFLSAIDIRFFLYIHKRDILMTIKLTLVCLAVDEDAIMPKGLNSCKKANKLSSVNSGQGSTCKNGNRDYKGFLALRVCCFGTGYLF
jgi:hypothetical protein